MSTLASALVGGLVGAVVGALLEGYFGWRTQRRHWIQDVRREVYARALATLYDLHKTAGRYVSHCKLALQATESPDLDDEHRIDLLSEADRIHGEMNERQRRARQLVEELELVGAMTVTMFARASTTLLPLVPRPWQLVTRDPDTRADAWRALEEAPEQIKKVEEYRESLLSIAKHDVGIGNEPSQPRRIRRWWRRVRDGIRE